MSNQSEIMTFRSGHNLFAVPITNVLSIAGETENLSCKAFRGNEMLGVAEYRGMPVSIIDFAKANGTVALCDEKKVLIDTLLMREKDHVDWQGNRI